ncbi:MULTISPECIES: tyrosine-type recombinase/integrase [Streptosporangium]|uniref:Integrase n=1 Tax=Streptosporangium brasiliense TaxID=47480 RepID=A0ABT9R9N8_9ACTN|nr:site-specific integrase [Streptosporangium brasiliense]MDP9865582.1 integrase [Streptosporangium brasiliense]
MTVYDRWHKMEKQPDGVTKKVRSSEYGIGDRWQVRWRDESGAQRKRNFPKKAGKDPNTCAEAFDAQITSDLNRGTYVDPNAGKITVKEYGDQWLAAQTFDRSSYELVEIRLRLHVYPTLGKKELRELRPSLLQMWLRGLQVKLAPNYVRTVFAHFSALLNAAVDDDLIPKNPCHAGSVKPPKAESKKIRPWSVEQVKTVAGAVTRRYEVMVQTAAALGLRQGEAFGLAVDDIDLAAGVVHVRRQVKLLNDRRMLFALPKGGKVRDVPLPESLALRLSDHRETFAPVEITLPWRTVDGPPHSAELVFTTRLRSAINRIEFNRFVWKPTLAKAGIPATRENGFHMLRHHFASVLLERGVSIKAVADFLGHADPGFTLRTYTHLMPSSEERMRQAVEDAWATGRCALDVP